MTRWPELLKARFLEFGPDAALVDYLERVRVNRAGWWRTRAQRLVRLLVSDYDANALLGLYPMHLLSTEQAARLLSRSRGGRPLDIGAGSGDVTAKLTPLFERVEVLETSFWAARHLAARGYTCHRFDVTLTGIRSGP